MVIAILAMLFIIGSTQLLVARFEKQSAEQKHAADNVTGVSSALDTSASTQLRMDAVGDDGTAYNSGWSTGETSLLEDSADFPGEATSVSGSTLTSDQLLRRSGDMLLSSLEPYYDSNSSSYLYFSVSGIADYNGKLADDNSFAAAFSRGKPELAAGGDADGDGVTDSVLLPTTLSSMYGSSSYRFYQRVISNGGMVMLDRMTHPALLAQVIHPSDSYHSSPWNLFDVWQKSDNDENRLRRRYMMPTNVPYSTDPKSEWAALPDTDLRKSLPYTLGYRSIGGLAVPHWWAVNPDEVRGDYGWWTSRITPGTPLASQGYSASSDTYDRRHLITTASYDDLLRPIREGSDYPNSVDVFLAPSATTAEEASLRPFYYVVSPADTKGTDPLVNCPTQPDGTDVNFPGLVAYGVTTAGGSLQFNKPGLRTPFSLRDVLVDPLENNGWQASYRRAMQLTAYYLAMLQRTSVGTDPAILARTAAQLAVNTIDFADNNDVNFNAVVEAGEIDPPTRLTFTLNTNPPQQIDVYGVERQPYITEIYAKVAEVYKDVLGQPVIDPDASKNKSIYAVEIYNPYDQPIDLTGMVLRVGGIPYELDTALTNAGATNALMGAHSILIFANQVNDPDATAAYPNPPFGGGGLTAKSYVIPVSADFKIPHNSETAVELVQTQSLTLAATGPTLETNDQLVLDRVSTKDAGSGFLGTFFMYGDAAISAPVAAITTSMYLAEPGPPDAPDPPEPQPDRFGEDLAVTSPSVGVTYWRHCSIQRLKEPNYLYPINWRFTVGVQARYESPLYDDSDPPLTMGYPVQGLFNVDQPAAWGSLAQNDIAEFWYPGYTGKLQEDVLRFHQIPPMQIVTSDRGMSMVPTVAGGVPSVLGQMTGTQAFPTTGTLLLVTRNGPTSYVGVSTGNVGANTPMTVMAVSDSSAATLVDNNHLPIFNEGQVCNDLTFADSPQGRYDMPWGQLVFSYFTALPLEELVREYPQASNPNSYLELEKQSGNRQPYEEQYGAYGSFDQNMPVFPWYPLVEREDGATSVYGPRVRGRININVAPWWVLDGLPTLADVVDPTQTIFKTLPVPEMISGALDRSDFPAYASNNAARPAQYVMDFLFDDDSSLISAANAGYTTISASMAHLLACHRELRSFGTAQSAFYEYNETGKPGFLTVGGIVDAIVNLKVQVQYNNQSLSNKFGLLRSAVDPADVNLIVNARLRPFSYLGYLQLVAPVVRVQDWATTKSHVYTIFNLIGDTNDPPVWLRSQTTVDRTRCLYSSDLPSRLAQLDPIGYYNAVSDQP